MSPGYTLVPAIHDLFPESKTWMPGTRPGVTTGESCVLFSLHELIGKEAIIGFKLLIWLEQPGLDIETFRFLERIRSEPQVARRDLADVLERDRELAIVELRKSLLEQRQRLVRAIEHHGRRLAEGRAYTFAQRPALRAGVGLGRHQRVGER